MAINVHGHQRSRARGYLRLDLGNVRAPRVRIGVHQYWGTAVVKDSRDAGDDRERWHDHFVARLQMQAGDCDLQGCRTIADRNPVTPATVAGPLPLKFLDEFP